MTRADIKSLIVRISANDLKQLRKVRECGDWDDDSAAVRFCIRFTKTMFSIIPAALLENFVQANEENIHEDMEVTVPLISDPLVKSI